MHLAVKNLFQFDERYVLIAGVVKLIFDRCHLTHFLPNWLLKFDSPPQLVIRSTKALLKTKGAEDLCEGLKEPTQGTLQIRTSMP